MFLAYKEDDKFQVVEFPVSLFMSAVDLNRDIHEAVQDLQDPSVALQVLSDIQQNKLCEYATDVAIQVLAYTLMEHGVLPPEIKQAAIKATEAQMDVIIEEGWCDPDLRKQSLLSFIQQFNTF